MRKTILMLLLVVVSSASASVGAQNCPAEGSGTNNDAPQNRQKNRLTTPTSFEEMTVAQFKQTFTPNLNTPRRRTAFSQAELDKVTPEEERGVTLTGYILRAVKQGKENTNCGSTTRTDVHIWIYSATRVDKAARTVLRGKAVVVEATPGWIDDHSDWTASRLEQIGASRVKVKISGWVMYDPEHPDKIGITRGTLWEIHPVTRIQYWTGTSWKDL
jgi:hypothetical protein